MKINKSNSITSAVVLFWFGIFLLIFLLGLSLFRQGNTVIDMGFLGNATVHMPVFHQMWQNIILFFLLPLPAVLCFERGVYDLNRGLGTRKDEVGASKSIWHLFAVYYKYADFVNNLIFTLVFLILTVFEIAVLLHSKPAFTFNTLAFFFGAAVYGLLRQKLVSGLKTTTNKLRKGFPSYTLFEDGIEMRLYPVGKGKRAVNPPHVRLDFDELDEVKVLNDVEAENYMKYTVGPDLTLSRAMVSDQYRYLKGEITRPSVFRSGSCTNSKSVLFRGKQLFYLITFETDDVGIIEESFNRHRKIEREYLATQGGSDIIASR